MAMHAQGEQGEHNRVCVVSSQCRDSASQNGERAHLKRRHGNASGLRRFYTAPRLTGRLPENAPLELRPRGRC